jgi:hypothetical protein
MQKLNEFFTTYKKYLLGGVALLVAVIIYKAVKKK